MASDPIASWQIEGERVEAVTDFLFLGSKIAVDGDCSHEIGRCLFLGMKAMTNQDSVLKSTDMTLPTKISTVKAKVFLVVTLSCESWTVKKTECWRIDVLELWCWRRLLRVPWTARRSNQSILREINPEYSLEGVKVLKLKLQYFGHLMQTADSLEKSLMLEKTEGRRRASEDETAGRHHWGNGHELGQASGGGDGQRGLACCSPWGRKELDTAGCPNNNNKQQQQATQTSVS